MQQHLVRLESAAAEAQQAAMEAEAAAAAAEQAATAHKKQLRAEQRYALLFGPYSSTLSKHVLTSHPSRKGWKLASIWQLVTTLWWCRRLKAAAEEAYIARQLNDEAQQHLQLVTTALQQLQGEAAAYSSSDPALGTAHSLP